MIKTDELYLENLSEFIYDDKKAVTYKFLSVFLGVHVNLAKQMLYTFYEREKKNGKKIYAIFYVSGMAREKVNLRQEDPSGSQEDDTYDRHIVLLCRESDLDEVKKKFSKLFSVHIYSLSANAVNDYKDLQSSVDKPVQDSEGRTPADFGPFTCNAELNPEKVKAVAPAPTPAPLQKDSKEKDRQLEERPKESQKPSSKTPNKNKNFFGTQTQGSSTDKKSGNKKSASTPNQSSIQSSFSKTKIVPKSEKVVDPEVDKPKESSKISKPVTPTKKKQASKSASKNRKRIRVDSDSDSEDFHSSRKRAPVFTSDDDDDSCDNLHGSPERRNASRRIDSDSEEEEIIPVPDSPETKKSTDDKLVSSNGRKRTYKTITKITQDEDGYDVTTREQVLVSEDDDEVTEVAMDIDLKKEGNAKNGIQEKAKLAEEAGKGDQNQPKSSSSPTEKTNGSSRKAPSTKAKTTSASQSKTKQASIMSFFQKK